jgi:Fe2+ or Zn2+ uptake regulation protein
VSAISVGSECARRSASAPPAKVAATVTSANGIAIHSPSPRVHAARGVASVYRTLDLLSAAGLVQRVEVGGRALYEAVVPGGEHHHHAVCERCGELTPFSDQALERAIDGLAGRLGHRVQGHEVLIRGECRACARS